MSKLFLENGSLSDEGYKLVMPIVAGLHFLMEDTKNLSVSELRILGANLAKLVGDQIFQAIKIRSDRDKFFDDMPLAEFEGYLKSKYGDKWQLTTLTPDEFRRLGGKK